MDELLARLQRKIEAELERHLPRHRYPYFDRPQCACWVWFGRTELPSPLFTKMLDALNPPCRIASYRRPGGLIESKDFVTALRDDKELLELVDDRPPRLPRLPRRPDSYNMLWHGSNFPKFDVLDHYGSGLAFVPGRMTGEFSAKNVDVDMEAIAMAAGVAAQNIPKIYEQIEKAEDNMDAKNTRTVEIIKEFCKNMESFTSLDVSNKVKECGLVVRHREIAELVRAAFANGVTDIYGYVRDLINVTLPGGGSAQAYLYRHTTVPADDYKNRAQVATKPPVQQAPQPVSPPYTDDDDDDLPSLPTPIIPQNLVPPQPPVCAAPAPHSRSMRVLNTSSVTRTQKGDGRLEVPHVWLARLGWQVGDTVAAVRDGNSLILKTDLQPGERAVRSFTVDRWSRIRITTKALNEAGIHFGTGGQHIMTLRTTDIKIN